MNEQRINPNVVLTLGGLIGLGYVLYKLFGPDPKKDVAIPPPTPGLQPVYKADDKNRPSGAVLPGSARDPGPVGIVTTLTGIGILAGALTSGVTAAIVSPSKGGRVYRRLLSSSAAITLEVANYTSAAQTVVVEVVASFKQIIGDDRPPVRTTIGPLTIYPKQVRRIDADMDTGNVNTGLFELGQGTAFVVVNVNGKATQSTSFEVW